MRGRPERVIEFDGQRKTIGEWARELGVNKQTVHFRLRSGKPLDTQRYARKCGAIGSVKREMWPGANEKPWHEDVIAQAVVNDLGPMTLSEIGRCIGVERTRVEQIERVAIAKIREAHGPAGARRMLDLLEPWRGQRGRVIRLLESSGLAAPRFGPRLAPRSIAGI